MSEPPKACGNCNAPGSWAPPVTVIVVAMPGRYPLIPEWDTNYQVCMNCKAIWRMIDRAVASCSATSGAGIWTEALLVCQDHLLIVKNQAATMARMALA